MKLYKPNYIITMKDIVNEKKDILHTPTQLVQTPLGDEDIYVLDNMMNFLKHSQDEQISRKYKLRPGVGLSANQIGLNKKMCAIYFVEENETTVHEYQLINPKIMRKSIHQIYLPQGEGCLSVDRTVYGIVPRSERVTIQYQTAEGVEQTLKLKGNAAIIAQHEIDHLNGVLFFDRIDQKNPLSPPSGTTSLY